jgi:hypothetical protein
MVNSEDAHGAQEAMDNQEREFLFWRIEDAWKGCLARAVFAGGNDAEESQHWDNL